MPPKTTAMKRQHRLLQNVQYIISLSENKAQIYTKNEKINYFCVSEIMEAWKQSFIHDPRPDAAGMSRPVLRKIWNS